MSKKYTMRDIARQAGVSVATVSYVINNRDDQRISEETKKKVRQIINLYDYRPNSSAKSLATNKTYTAALYLSHEDSLYKRSEQLYVAESLSAVLKRHGYHLLLQDQTDFDQIDYTDVILCYDVTAEFFREIGDKNLIPLIAIDTIVDARWLFFQVCTDYAKQKAQADAHFGTDNYRYCCLAPNNAQVGALIRDTFHTALFMTQGQTAPAGNIVYSQASLRTLLPDHALYLPCDPYAKMEQVFSCMELAMNRVPDCTHLCFV